MWKRNGIIILMIGMVVMFVMAAAPARAAGSPVDAFKKLGRAAEKKNWGAFWDGCEKTTQQAMGQLFLFALAIGSMDKPDVQQRLNNDFGNISKESMDHITRDQFIKIMAYVEELSKGEDDKPGALFDAASIKVKEQTDTRAVLTVRSEGRPMEDVVMVLEGGEWKFFMANPFDQEKKGGPPPAAQKAPEPEKEPAPKAERSEEQKARETLKKFFKK